MCRFSTNTILRGRTRRAMLWLVVPALLVGVVTIPACRKEKPAAEPKAGDMGANGSRPSGAQSAAAGAPIEVTSQRLRGVDDQDEPDAPRALPKTSELRAWVKTSPVRMGGKDGLYEPIRWRGLDEAERRAAFETVRIQRTSRCVYSRSQQHQGQVLFVEAATPEDAFGLFRMMTAEPGELRADGSLRARQIRSGGTIWLGWQGNVVVRVAFTGGGPTEESEAQDEQLFDRILFNVPATEPPLLVRAIPLDRRQDCHVWVVRSAALLRLADNDVLREIDFAIVNGRLGLTGEAILSVAVVPVADDESPNVIWLVQYATPAAAAAAYQRCKAAFQSPVGPLDHNTIVEQPRGVFLVGSWTADQESIPNKNLLPILREALGQ